MTEPALTVVICIQGDGITRGTVHLFYNHRERCACGDRPLIKKGIEVYQKGGLTYLREKEKTK